ncbi:WXG100 family type VII secretion target [Streptomyces jeddahensis]|uniref:Proteins of 100 residues with WXG n=1 Tax=Streptomyces jeddahensis TaxID=1716141 RepID=A0A177HJ97_9ACTN|nr:WXG100 family type VII secretion target [Streptomyces jeddahensis]OAH10719.1 proteins of 100 residues with WXG [Streptomyces jeddahensis]
MSGNESVAEEIVEAGFEVISPGGRPEELRQAAKAWRKLRSDVAGPEGILQALDKNVEATVGDTWRGPAAEAFRKHWTEFRKAVEQATEQYDEIAAGLDEAADAIEECNEEIQAIYAEIGISIGVGVALSFVTFGFGGAAAAANAARLAAQAVRIAGRLGEILRRIGTAFRTLRTLAQTHKFLANVGINAIGNFAGSLGGAAVEGGGITPAELGEAAWQSSLGALAGTGPGLFVAGKVAGRLGDNLAGAMASGAAGGATGNVTGGFVVDGVRMGTGDLPVSGDGFKEMGYDALANAIGGSVGGGAAGGIGYGASHQSDGVQKPDGFPDYPQRTGPDTAFEGIPAGLGATGAGAATSRIEEAMEGDGSDGGDQKDSPKVETRSQPSAGRRSIRDDFG